ncbi:hypothetical protein QE152_g31235 [Popillia japonica]|uniref:Uncharacterized protein n=1 Tax=Popillia japonica TaxID=7064 RepID=A0AAW1JCB2_POPJA
MENYQRRPSGSKIGSSYSQRTKPPEDAREQYTDGILITPAKDIKNMSNQGYQEYEVSDVLMKYLMVKLLKPTCFTSNMTVA